MRAVGTRAPPAAVGAFQQFLVEAGGDVPGPEAVQLPPCGDDAGSRELECPGKPDGLVGVRPWGQMGLAGREERGLRLVEPETGDVPDAQKSLVAWSHR